MEIEYRLQFPLENNTKSLLLDKLYVDIQEHTPIPYDMQVNKL